MPAESIPKAYRPWLILSLAVLVLSLFVLAIVATMAFISYADTPTPLWLSLLGFAAGGGVALGFAGFLGMMLVAGWTSFRDSRRVQVIPPSHEH